MSHYMLCLIAVGPWKAPSTGGEQGMGLPQGRSTADAADGDLQWPWDPASRCYLADMHDTEVQALCLGSHAGHQPLQPHPCGTADCNALIWDAWRLNDSEVVPCAGRYAWRLPCRASQLRGTSPSRAARSAFSSGTRRAGTARRAPRVGCPFLACSSGRVLPPCIGRLVF